MRRTEASYARRGPSREPYASVLIVCEGGKSEPNYLFGLVSTYRLSSANIRITPADGTDPVSVVKYAQELYVEGKYDRVYCVFDRDEHPNYDEALQLIARLANFFAITSWPCFEIWILLHFIYSAAPRDRNGALAEVLKYYGKYTKDCRTCFGDLKSRLDDALHHARRLEGENRKTGSTNPSTKMHNLVEYLIRLKA